MTHLSMKTVLLSAAAAALALLALIAAVGYFALQYTSSAAYDMGLGKDVVADILPPPLYVIEAQLIAYDLTRAPRRAARSAHRQARWSSRSNSMRAMRSGKPSRSTRR